MRFLLLPIVLAATFPAFAAGTAPATGPSATAPAKPPAAAPAPAKPADDVWFVAKTSGGALGYHASGIQHDPNLGTVSMTSVLYTRDAAKSPGGKPFQILLAQDNYDCIGRQLQPLARLMMSADGQPVEEGEVEKPTWKPVGKDPALNLLMGVACSGKALQGAKKAIAFPAAAKLMREMK